jgi:hypothetical protein
MELTPALNDEFPDVVIGPVAHVFWFLEPTPIIKSFTRPTTFTIILLA